MSRSLLEMKLF